MLKFSEQKFPPLGKITFAAEDNRLVGLWLEGQKHFLFSYKNDLVRLDDDTTLCKAKEWIGRYMNGEKPEISELKLAPSGSEFRQIVWKILCEIPYGEVITYGKIAKEVADIRGVERMSAQAVGNAVGHNPISIIIPCHRVVGANGSMTGYAGGIDKKIFLLRHEEASGIMVNNFTLQR